MSQQPSADDLFAAVVLLYLDGTITSQGLAYLIAELDADADHRSTFVRLCALFGNLSETMKAMPARCEPRSQGDCNLAESVWDNSADSILNNTEKANQEPNSSTTIRDRVEGETLRMPLTPPGKQDPRAG
jgi:hypothetical protein